MTALSPPSLDPIPLGQSHQWIRGDKSKLESSLTDELALGRKKLNRAFRTLQPRTLKHGELLAAPAGYRSAIFRLRTGWTCQFRYLSNGRAVIIDVYLPGDVIGLDTVLRTPTIHRFLTLTSVTLEVIPVEDGFLNLIANRSVALYIFWLLGQSRGRSDRRLAANTRLEAEARLAMMVLDFYTRLRRRELITTSTYKLPLTQTQIGDYLGLSAVHVNRVLRLLRDERVVNLDNHCMTILDLKRLEGWTKMKR